MSEPKSANRQMAIKRLRDDLKARPRYDVMRKTCGVKVKPTFYREQGKAKVVAAPVPVKTFKAYTSPTPIESAWLKFRSAIEPELKASGYYDYCRID